MIGSLTMENWMCPKTCAQGNEYYRPVLNIETLRLMKGQGTMAEGVSDHYMGIQGFNNFSYKRPLKV